MGTQPKRRESIKWRMKLSDGKRKQNVEELNNFRRSSSPQDSAASEHFLMAIPDVPSVNDKS